MLMLQGRKAHRLPSRYVYSMAVLCYVAVHRLVLAVVSLFWDCTPIPMCRENETTRTIPTYIESATALSDIRVR